MVLSLTCPISTYLPRTFSSNPTYPTLYSIYSTYLTYPTHLTLPTLSPYIRIIYTYTSYEPDLLTRPPSTPSPRKGGQPTVATFTLLGQLKSGPLALWAAPPRLGPPALAFCSIYVYVLRIYIRIRITYKYMYKFFYFDFK